MKPQDQIVIIGGLMNMEKIKKLLVGTVLIALIIVGAWVQVDPAQRVYILFPAVEILAVILGLWICLTSVLVTKTAKQDAGDIKKTMQKLNYVVVGMILFTFILHFGFFVGLPQPRTAIAVFYWLLPLVPIGSAILAMVYVKRSVRTS